MTRSKSKVSWLHPNVVRLANVHFVFVVLFAIQTMVYDAWDLVAPLAVLNRWLVTAALGVVTTAVWYLAHNSVKSTSAFKGLVWLLVVADISAASFNIYTQRGMASRAVMLYAVPIVVSSVLLSRAALFAGAALSAAAYVSTAVAYFVLNFNEGYKIELYGEVGFYSVIFFVLADLLWIVIRSRRLKPGS